MNRIHNGKLCCQPFWSQCRVNRRDPSAKGSPTNRKGLPTNAEGLPANFMLISSYVNYFFRRVRHFRSIVG
ncbi:MAG: hypothetical protein LBL62_10600 [Planctomycetaceae bacterium]|nr:hypothetical protein [Planctomycetaceae bacterium]